MEENIENKQIISLQGQVDESTKLINELKTQLSETKEQIKPFIDIPFDPNRKIDKLTVTKINGEDYVAGLNYTELYSATHSNTADSTWQDWDLTSLVAAGTKYAEIVMLNTQNVIKAMGVRKNGSALARTFNLLPDTGLLSLLVELDDDLVIETYSADYANTYFVLTGYFS